MTDIKNRIVSHGTVSMDKITALKKREAFKGIERLGFDVESSQI